MVVYQTEKPYYGIVDGQQRLTTITLMLAAIRNAFLKYGDENLARGVHQYIEKANIDNVNEYILNSETSFPYLQGYIQSFKKLEIQYSVGSEEQNLKSAFELINKKLYSMLPTFDENDLGNDLFQERKTQILEILKSLMILSLIRAYRESKITLRILRQILWKIECFHFIFNSITSQRSSGSIGPLYAKFAQEISNTDSQDKIQSINTELVRKLKEKLPSYDEFEVDFLDLIYTKNKQRDKKLIQYILEKFTGQNINGLPIDYNSASIEHILPQSKDNEEIVGSIGNLILVDRQTNSEELKDFDFMTKIKILKEKKYPLDDILLNATQWNQDEIKARGKEMSRKAYYVIWKL